jgi:hypothetical protein
MTKEIISIDEVENEYHDHFLDVIGNEFKFDHSKGMAEWLKNSIDAYYREGILQDEQYVVFRFTDKDVLKPTVECIDFVGMEQKDIDNAFKRWGDPDAAKKGGNIKVHGGHGNGGKFYMRQMFQESSFITYKNGFLNIFGFSPNKKYGYAKDYKGKKMTPEEACDFIDINSIPVPQEIKNKVLEGKTGFTLIQGIGPEDVRGKFKMSKEMEKFKNHPQSRRILQHSKVSIIYNNESLYGLLKPDEIDPMEKFEIPRIIEVPKVIPIMSGNEKVIIELANEKFQQGRLILKTSNEALARGTKLGELNRIDILGEIGVIGSYQLFEMGVTGFPDAAFIYGECEVPILESSSNDCVSNDRSKLVKNETTDTLITWIAQEIDKLAAEITALKREKQRASQKDINSKFNDVLNQWKNKFMKKILSDIINEGTGGGGGGGGGGGWTGTEITPPINGFDFKYPRAEIQIEKSSGITLKVSVPEALPLGAGINISTNNDNILCEEEKYYIRSDYLKATSDGHEVAFINIDVVGKKIGDSILTASAGELSSSINLQIIESKEDTPKNGKAFPRVLLSGHDTDPLGLATEDSLYLGERDPVVYQRPQDVSQSIYWINTSSPMASKIYDKFKFDSIQWRNFLFERYVDIFVKEAIHELYKKDFENFTADSVDQKISEVVRKIHQSAKEDLSDFLFDESYKV